MTRTRDKRESQALKILILRRTVTAAELASAAVAGEGRRFPAAVLDNLGLKLGTHFVQRGFARINHTNHFEWVPNG